MKEALEAGDKLAHFVIRKRLGAGGMGVVYLAHDDKLERDVALKVLPPAVASDEERRSRFQREAKSAARMLHPNIAAIFEVGESEGRLFIAMEYVTGRSLRERIAEGALEPAEAVRITHDITQALTKAHSLGIVHRDIKPDNVMLTEEGHVKVLDFGLAKLFAGDSEDSVLSSETEMEQMVTSSQVTAEGRIMGTPGYMSPEQARGKDVDLRTDLFAVGVILYEMLAGEQPFAGETPLDKLAAVTRDDPPTLEQTPELDAIIKHCLEKQRDNRYADGKSLLDALDALQGDALESSRALPSQESAIVSSGSAVTTQSKGAPRRLLAIGAVVLTFAGLAFAVTRGDEREVDGATAPSDAVASASATSGPAITDLPDPATDNAEALASYQQGLRALRNASWLKAHRYFQKATELDEGFAAAHLRLALTSHWYDPATETRVRYQRAVDLKDKLSPRDAALLDALRPLIQSDPPDLVGCIDKLHAASRAHPSDAELAYLPALLKPEPPEPALEAANRAIELDPEYADALQQRAAALRRLGRAEEALATVARCAELVPDAIDCLSERTVILRARGDCEGLDKALRGIIGSVPDQAGWYTRRVNATASMHASMSVPRDLLQQALKLEKPERREMLELEWDARISIAYGNFDAAEGSLRKLLDVVSGEANQSVRAAPLGLLADLHGETGDTTGAIAVAKDYVERHAAWASEPQHGFLRDREMQMWGILHAAGEISTEALRTKREAWLVRWADDGSDAWRWSTAFSSASHRLESAKRAISKGQDVLATADVSRSTRADAVGIGRILIAAEQPKRAIPWLEGAARACTRGTLPFTAPRAYRLLGDAHSSLGDDDLACLAYASARERWANAKPRSVTAEHAAKRMKELGCADATKPAPSK